MRVHANWSEWFDLRSERSRRFTIPALLALGAAAVASACQPGTTTIVASPDAGGIMVNGTGSVTVMPDIAVLNLGVEARGASVADARTAAAGAMESVRGSLRQNGVDERDIKTSGLSINPQYAPGPVPTPTPFPPTPVPPVPPVPQPGAGGASESPAIEPAVRPTTAQAIPGPGGRSSFAGEPVIVGYIVSNTLTIKVRNLDSASKVLDDAIAAAGDRVRVHGIQFTVDEPERYYAEAREKAMQDAKARADDLARLAGVTLGRPRSINEYVSGPMPLGRGGTVSAQAADPSTPLSAGETEVQMQVNVTYELR